MPDNQFFSGPALLALFPATTVTGAGEAELGSLTIKYRPNQYNSTMLDIVTPRAGDACGPAKLTAEDLVTSRDAFVYQIDDALLIDIRGGMLGPATIPPRSHVLWLIQKDSIGASQAVSKKRLFGGTKEVGLSFTVQSPSNEAVSRAVTLEFLSNRDTQKVRSWLT